MFAKDDMSGVSLTAHYTAFAWEKLGAPEAHRFVTWQGRMLHGLVRPLAAAVRTMGIDHPVSLLLEPRYRILEHELKKTGSRCFVELASGLSPRGTAYSRDPSVTYVEVDLPGMIPIKKRRVGSGRGENQHFVAGDVLDPDTYRRIRPLLKNCSQVTVLSEGLSAYLRPPAFESFLKHVATFLKACGGGVFFMDVTPVDAVRRFGPVGWIFSWGIGVVARWSLGLPVDSVSHGVRMMRAAGFNAVKVHDPGSHPATSDLDAEKIRGVVLIFEGRVSGDGQNP